MIVVVDFGMGNLGSVARALSRVEQEVEVSSSAGDIAAAERLVLPGVGSFKRGMDNLRRLDLVDVLNRRVLQDRVPVLGICLGFQMFTAHSEEGDVDGFGWIDGRTARFQLGDNPGRLKVPHIGWNDLARTGAHPMFADIEPSADFYFQHTYAVRCDDPDVVLATATYGQEFVAAVHKDNIVGAQFHPEKSTANGLQFLRNWVELSV